VSGGRLSPAGEVPVAPGLRWSLPGEATAVFTDRDSGDLGGSGVDVEARRRSVVDRPWTLLRQVHGARVVVVDRPGAGGGEAADGSVTALDGVALGILTADCAPVALSSPEGVIGVAHAGWRGLQAGVVEATVAAMRRLGASDVEAVLGPCIHPCCYEFGAEDLAALSEQFGAAVESVDREGRAALDVPAAVEVALARVGVPLVGQVSVCTGCSGRHFSWRARRDPQRQATVVWR
jgi:polyphenol oxidase